MGTEINTPSFPPIQRGPDARREVTRFAHLIIFAWILLISTTLIFLKCFANDPVNPPIPPQVSVIIMF